MILIHINKEISDTIEKYSKKLDIGGFSNLSQNDLNKASRLVFQKHGIAAEAAWFLHRYGTVEALHLSIDKKLDHYYKTKKGDDGCDDTLTSNNKTRFIDIKCSFAGKKDKIKNLNLIIPPREFHQNMIYIAAFTLGESREDFDNVILAGWEINECITKKWKIDPTKFCVPVSELRPMKELEEYIR